MPIIFRSYSYICLALWLFENTAPDVYPHARQARHLSTLKTSAIYTHTNNKQPSLSNILHAVLAISYVP